MSENGVQLYLLKFEQGDDIQVRRDFPDEVVIGDVEGAVGGGGQGLRRQELLLVGRSVEAARGGAVEGSGITVTHDSCDNLNTGFYVTEKYMKRINRVNKNGIDLVFLQGFKAFQNVPGGVSSPNKVWFV